MSTQFGVHKLWFFYTDEWYVTDDDLANCMGIFASEQEAEEKKLEMDIKALRNMRSPDYIRDLTGFMEKRGSYQDNVKDLINYAKAIGWEDYVREQFYYNSDKTYFELSIPSFASDEELAEILSITGAYFHRVIEYRSVDSFAYIRFNSSFWGRNAFKQFKEEGHLEERKPYINNQSSKGWYLIHKPPKGRKSAKFRAINVAWEKAIRLTVSYLHTFPDKHFLGKTYVEEWSEQPILLMNFLKNCKSIELQEEQINASNSKAIKAKLKKLKANTKLEEGQVFFKVSFPTAEEIDLNEMKALIDLLKVKPFQFFELHSSINGEEIKTYYPDHGIL